VTIRADRTLAYVADRYARCVWKFKNSTVDVADRPEVPGEFSLQQNYPNPFNPSTIISFTLPLATHVTLTVSDVLGRRVATLVNGPRPAGKYAEVFTAANLPSGVYVATVATPACRVSMKMMLVK
jgi:hypothetical protein